VSGIADDASLDVVSGTTLSGVYEHRLPTATSQD
jgi:hypothetical protein